MTMDMEAFEWAQGLLRGLLISLNDRLPGQSLELLGELVDAAELPLAMDLLLRALERHEVALISDEIVQLVSVANRTGVSSSYLESLS